MNNRKCMKIFIGLRELSGYYHNLKQGFDTLGIESVFVNLSGHPYQYGTDANPAWINAINRMAQKVGTRFFSSWTLRILWIGFFQNVLSLFLFLWALFKFDAFIFASNSTFFFFLDLPVLKMFKKKIIYVFHGSEARPVYLNGYVIKNESRKTIWTGIILARIQKMIITIIDRFADYSINIPPQAYFHSKPFVSWLMVGVPHSAGETTKPKVPFAEESRTSVRILHAPSKPGPKGTPVIRHAIQSLKAKGHAIDFVEITGRPNREVLEELQRCDFVVDELYSDTPMAVFATEAAFAGKPTVVGGYYSQNILQDVASECIPPSLFCHPDDLENAIEKMVTDKAYREQLGQKAYGFVRTHWSAERVAARFLRLVDGDVPQDWFYDPYQIRYLHGCGLSEEKAKRIIGKFIAAAGQRALCLEDKPDLVRLFTAFASSEHPS